MIEITNEQIERVNLLLGDLHGAPNRVLFNVINRALGYGAIAIGKRNPADVQHQARGHYRESKHEDEAGDRGRLGGFNRVCRDGHSAKTIQGFPVGPGAKDGFRFGAESRGRKAAGTRFRR